MGQENEDARVLKEAKSRINALLEGKIPDAMDVKSYDSELGTNLAESINVLIKSFLVINDVIISASGGLLDKSASCEESFQSLAFKSTQDCQVQLGLEGKETADDNNSQCIDFKGANWGRLNAMFEQLRGMESALNESIKGLAKDTRAIFQERIAPLSDDEVEDD